MREIEFRAKAINRDPNREYRTNYKNGDWVYGLVTRFPIKTSFGTTPAEMNNMDGIEGIEVDVKTLGQYTGLKDKNGVKIFEGDILEYEFEDIGKQKAYVNWNGKYSSFTLEVISEDFEYTPIESGAVIGNIYDNSELLG